MKKIVSFGILTIGFLIFWEAFSFMVWAFISYYQYRDRIFSFGLPVLQGSRSSFAAYVSYSSKRPESRKSKQRMNGISP